MSFEQIVTYIVTPLLAAGAAIWGLVKWVIPKFVDAKITEQKDIRGHRQKQDELSQAFYHSEREVTNQALASVVATAQEKEEKADEFVRNTVFNALDKIKTDTSHIPGLITEIRIFEDRITGLETRQRLLVNLITGGKVVEDEEPKGDYDTWKNHKLGRQAND